MSDELRTPAVEDFLKTVYLLQQQAEHPDDPVPTNLLAQALNIKAPSVTDMVKRLAGVEDEKDEESIPTGPKPAPFLEYVRYKGVRLTPLGEKIALEVIRHHRLIELYLSQKLGYSWDEVHEEADRLEHVISEQFEARIAAALGNPRTDPHGDPIPTLEGTLPEVKLSSIADLPAGKKATVSQIIDQHTDVLRYLSDLGLTPGARLKITERSPLNDTISLRIGDDPTIRTISIQVARQVLVTPV